MKSIAVTRKVKESIYSHFLRGGKAVDLPEDLKRAPLETIQACQVRAFEAKKRGMIPRGLTTTTPTRAEGVQALVEELSND